MPQAVRGVATFRDKSSNLLEAKSKTVIMCIFCNALEHSNSKIMIAEVKTQAQVKKVIAFKSTALSRNLATAAFAGSDPLIVDSP